MIASCSLASTACSDKLGFIWDPLERLLDGSAAAALGDPVRLRLFSIIAAEGEACSCHFEGPLERSQPTISHHTKILAEAGLIVGEKRGRWVWWHVVPECLEMAADILKGP